MTEKTAKHVGEIVGLGLAANYMDHASGGATRHPDMEGGINPRLAPTGDPTHDMAMQAGRLAANVGISWVIVHFIWPFYALMTAIITLEVGSWLGAAWSFGRAFGHSVAQTVYTPYSDPSTIMVSTGGVSFSQLLPGLIIWAILQVLFYWGCARLFDGKRRKPVKVRYTYPVSDVMGPQP